ncbi:MAG: M16 family metallopeptidase [Alphaproteobacteria bacterium]
MKHAIPTLVLLATLRAAALPADARAAAPAVERPKLGNGLQLVLSTQASVPIVAISCLVDGGARLDPPGKEGLAELTGGLLSEGTKGRSSQDISKIVDSLGAHFSTGASQDWVEVGATVLARDFETGVDLVARSLREPTFPPEEFTRAKAETLGSIESSEDEPQAVAGRAFRKALFGSAPYGTPVDGSLDSVKKLSREDVLAYHASLDPSKTLCAIVGDVETARMKEVAGRLLGAWQPQAKSLPQPRPAEAPPARKVIVDRPVAQASIVLGQIGVPRTDPDWFPIVVMNHVLGGGGFTSRLMKRIRTQGGLAYGVSSAFGATRLPGPFQVVLQTKVASAGEAASIVREELQRLHDEGATEEELAAAKDYLTGNFPMKLDSTAKIAGMLAQMQYFGLGDDYIDRYAERVRAVTLDDVRRASKAHLHPDALVQVVVGPKAELEKQGFGSDATRSDDGKSAGATPVPAPSKAAPAPSTPSGKSPVAPSDGPALEPAAAPRPASGAPASPGA